MKSRREILKVARQKRRQKKLAVFTVLLAVVLTVLIIGIVALNFKSWRLQTFTVVGNETVDGEKITNNVKESLRGRLALVLPRDSSLFWSEKIIINNLLQAFPVLREVKVYHPERSLLKIVVSEKESDVLYCLRDKDNKKECYFMDSDGLVYAPAPIFSEAVYQEIIGQKASSSPLNTKPLTAEELNNLKTLMPTLAEILGRQWGRVIGISTAETLGAGDYVLYIKELEAGGSWKLLLSGRRAPQELLANLMSAIGSDVFGNQVSVLKTELDYVDLRFGNKVFYKFKQP